MNKVILKGRLTRNPDVRYTNSNEPVCVARFTLAVEDRSWKLEEGKYHVDYISCYAMGKLAELIEKSVGKGQELLLSGKWRTSSYEKDGKPVYSQSMFIQELEYCGKKADNPAPYDDSFMNIPEGFDDLPFK